jgi:photosystem II stability/assembly factor-like uncharacterized protein
MFGRPDLCSSMRRSWSRCALALILASAPASTLHAQARAMAGPTASFDPARFQEMRYRQIGPARGGRVTAVTGIASQPLTFYMGSTGGGVWKTTDAGVTWENVSDGFFDVGSMGAIDVADSDPNVIYAGTGSEGLRSNVSVGKGVYKSTDGAKTWTRAGLRGVGQIGAVVIHPTDANVVYVAAVGDPFKPTPERGVYRTRDGGASWQKVLFVSDSTGAVDIELNPVNPREIYASMWRAERKPWTIISGAREGGIYKSSDGGDSWTKLTQGLPSGLVGKSDLAVSPADPARVYALIEAPPPQGGVYRSDDRGATWKFAGFQTGILNRPFYYTNIDADPKNADVIYINNESFFRSTDGGKTFKTMTTPHGDNHDMWINPNDPNIWVQSNDGGANVTLNGGKSWSTQYNQPTAEIYQVATDNQFPYRVYGAQQDNTTVIVPSLPVTANRPDDPMQLWRTGPGCETGPIAPHPTNPQIVYGACKGQFSRLSLETGQEKNYWVGSQFLYGFDPKDLLYRFQRVSPLEISPYPKVGSRFPAIYYGSQYVHRTTDEGVTWERISPDLTANDPTKQGVSGQPITRDVTGEEYYSTLYAIRESPLESGLIWAGANDGPVHVTRDNGKSWTNVTPKDLAPGARIQNIEPSPHRRGSAYLAAYRYLLGDYQPYIYRTDDYGKSWTRLTDGANGIPADFPTRVVREDPEREGLLYAGTEFGMFVSFDNGRRWQPFQLNLPATPITDIKVMRKDLVLSTQGRSFWILDDLTPLHQFSDQVASAGVTLLKPRDAYRVHYQTFGNDPAAPQYPPRGAMIHYYVGAEVKGPITLDIVDASGKVVRSFSSEGGAGEATRSPASGAMGRFVRERAGPTTLAKDQGLHRFVWDLGYPGPWDSSATRSGRDGPLVVPGRFRARLTAGNYTATQPFAVRIDPRVARDGVTLADLTGQLAHNLRVRDAVTEAKKAVASLQAARGRLGKEQSPAAKDTLQRLATVERQLTIDAVRYSQPMLLEQLTYLYEMTTSADQKIGRDAVERFRQLRSELDAQLAELKRLTGSDATVQATAR